MLIHVADHLFYCMICFPNLWIAILSLSPSLSLVLSLSPLSPLKCSFALSLILGCFYYNVHVMYMLERHEFVDCILDLIPKIFKE